MELPGCHDAISCYESLRARESANKRIVLIDPSAQGKQKVNYQKSVTHPLSDDVTSSAARRS